MARNLTHFISIPLMSAQFTASLEAFRPVVAKHGLSPLSIRSPRSMHFTLGILNLPGETEISRAVQVLEELKSKEILANLENSNPRTVCIRGLYSLDRPARTAALYAWRQPPVGWLQNLCVAVEKHFFDNKVIHHSNRKELVLRPTIWNNVHMKDRGGQRVDARALIAEYKGRRVWADQVPIDKVQICRMGMVGDEGDKHFAVEAEVSLD
ncbi:hypothetical protein CDD80_3604 [Ophiocordyceps camponoti-rufipedis]|uniref:A-kinase anchor protein 7-like phosphoesterase domain-containing protein n=1 Tax=Ophiocordyceps camponoti-rufipedis TaxID=2004952 RepID=A0A2C5Z180_9HYPO|nr:hypothetical protein CDD80_3604 [Ophiocordyceps camponoti-rufipedis]